jgi:stress response protein YsnF
MADKTAITVGMPVFGADERPLGVVEAVTNDVLTVGTLQIPREAVGRVSAGAVHLRVAGTALAAHPDNSLAATAGEVASDTTETGDHLVVPVVEERLAVGTREVNLGEVEIRKRVVEETIMQPVTVRREVVEVVQRDASGREIGAQEVVPTATPPEQQ